MHVLIALCIESNRKSNKTSRSKKSLGKKKKVRNKWMTETQVTFKNGGKK